MLKTAIHDGLLVTVIVVFEDVYITRRAIFLLFLKNLQCTAGLLFIVAFNDSPLDSFSPKRLHKIPLVLMVSLPVNLKVPDTYIQIICNLKGKPQYLP